jgi:hypothetical protein
MPASDVSVLFRSSARAILSEGMRKLEHCLNQLDDESLWWRPTPRQNSIANLMLHLMGNVRQWIVSGVGGAADVRDRPREFSDRSGRPKAEVLETLRAAVRDADAVLARLTPEQLILPRRIQGFDTTVLAAVFDTVAHFRGHVQEIIHITRSTVGDRYVFDFVPKGPEQTSAARGAARSADERPNRTPRRQERQGRK